MIPDRGLPPEITTSRLLLRRWRVSDAARLLPLLQSNADHLRGWIPQHVAEVVPLADLEVRLAQYSVRFDANLEWRYAILSSNADTLLGEASLFARDAERRVPLAVADRFEIGYWIDKAATGRGFAREATLALFDVARSFRGLHRIEIRCDPRNLPSAAIPRRLGFELENATDSETDTMVWYHAGTVPPELRG